MGNWTSGQESLPGCWGNATWLTFQCGDYPHTFITPAPGLDFCKLPHKAIRSICTNDKSRHNWTRGNMQYRPLREIVFLGVGTVSDFLDRSIVQDFNLGKIIQAGQERRYGIRILNHCCDGRISVYVDVVGVLSLRGHRLFSER